MVVMFHLLQIFLNVHPENNLKEQVIIWGLDTNFQALEKITYFNCIRAVKRKS